MNEKISFYQIKQKVKRSLTFSVGKAVQEKMYSYCEEFKKQNLLEGFSTLSTLKTYIPVDLAILFYFWESILQIDILAQLYKPAITRCSL